MKRINHGRVWGYLLWCAALGVLYFFENGTGTRAMLCAACFAPPLLAFFAWLGGRRARAELFAPESANKSQGFTVECRVRTAFPLAVYRVRLVSRNLLTNETAEAFSTVGFRPARFQLACAHCGMLELRAELIVMDACHFFHIPLPPAKTDFTLVRPALALTELLELSERDAFQSDRYAPDRPGGDFSETFAVRAYVPGDPVRQIHWKLSQKLRQPLVRELSLPLSEQTLLVFDAAMPDGCLNRAALLDRLAEAFLSLSRALASLCLPHAVCWRAEGEAACERHAVEAEADWLNMTGCFFRSPPDTDASLPFDVSGAQSVIYVSARFPLAEDVPADIPVTVIAAGELPDSADYRAIPLP